MWLHGFIIVILDWFPRLPAWHDAVLRPLLVHALGLILLILAGVRQLLAVLQSDDGIIRRLPSADRRGSFGAPNLEMNYDLKT